jgi:hypothetical protein
MSTLLQMRFARQMFTAYLSKREIVFCHLKSVNERSRTNVKYEHNNFMNIFEKANTPIIQPIYVETSVRNKCRCSFYCAVLTLHVSAPIGGHLQVVCNTKNSKAVTVCQRIRCFSMFNNLRGIKYKI